MNRYLRRGCLFFGGALAVLLFSCGERRKYSNVVATPAIEFEVVERFAHNTDDFTQGLVYDETKKQLWESTGQNGKSRITSRLFDGKTWSKEKEWVRLAEEYFGEGITILGAHLYQLTWKNQKAFVYSYPALNLEREVTIPYEGWGITNDGTHLLISDGTSKIRWINPVDFSEVKTITVHDNYGSLDYINELEMVENKLYANRWQTEKIVQIDTTDGSVKGEMDLAYLALEDKNAHPNSDVPNGIAYDKENQVLFLTGKKWAYMYKVRLK